jgi:hypothetical protein
MKIPTPIIRTLGGQAVDVHIHQTVKRTCLSVHNMDGELVMTHEFSPYICSDPITDAIESHRIMFDLFKEKNLAWPPVRVTVAGPKQDDPISMATAGILAASGTKVELSRI